MIDKKKALKIIKISKLRAENKAKYYAPINKKVEQLWLEKYEAYELARRALQKEIDYDIKVYGE